MEGNRPLFYSGANTGLIYSAAIGIYFLLAFVGQSILGAFLKTTDFWYIAVNCTFSLIALLSVTIFCSVRSGKKLSFYTSFKVSPIVYLSSVFLAAGMFFGLGFINGLISDLLVKWGANVPAFTVPLNNLWQFFLFLILLAILPAIIEELFFRGIIFEVPINNRWVKYIAVGLVFAVYHSSFTQLVYQFIYGVLLSLIADKGKSVTPCIIAHLLNNVLVLTLEYLKVEINLFSPYLIAGGIAAIVAAVVLCEFAARKGKTEKGKSETALFFAYSGLGMAVCLLSMVLSLIKV